jgi:TetR/AcrR family transcriptional regulator, regulator of cefoperazone and chloramphenicol sensitivity
MPPTSTPTDPATRERLLSAAGEVFADRGFRAATIRAICTRARANVAAIHYHFGDKERLYGEVLEHALRTALELYPPDLGVKPDAPPEERLHAFVRSFLLRILDESVPSYLFRMMTREMIEPTSALDDLVQRVQRPLFERLRAIVAEILGPDADPRATVLCCQSVVGQCLFYRHCQPVITRMQHFPPSASPTIDELADHITRISLAGIRAYRDPRPPDRRKP